MARPTRRAKEKRISGGLLLPSRYTKQLAEDWAEDRRRRQRDAEKVSRLRSARLAGKTRKHVYKRDEHIRVALVRENATELRSLARHRGGNLTCFVANLVEEMVWLWSEYPGDPVLYVKRCEDPAEAEACIQPDFVPTDPRPTLADDRRHHLRMCLFFESVWEMLAHGYTVEDLKAEMELMHYLFRTKQPYTRSMGEETFASDRAAWKRRKAARDAALEAEGPTES